MNLGETPIPVGQVKLGGELVIPPEAKGLVVFAHGSGSSRHSSRNQFVAGALREAHLGTLLFDLLTAEEEEAEYYTRHLRFNIPFLAERLVAVTRWALKQKSCLELRAGYFGASTGAAAALLAAAELGDAVCAVVSRGGRPDLAESALAKVRAPTLLIVGSRDTPVIPLNQLAYERLPCEKALELVTGATHLFEEPGTLATVADLAARWFARHLTAPVRGSNS